MRGTLPKHQIQSHEEKGMKKKKYYLRPCITDDVNLE